MPKFSPEKVFSFNAKGLGYGRLVVHARSLAEAKTMVDSISGTPGVRVALQSGRFVRRQRA